MRDLWPNFDSQERNPNNSITIIKEQAKLLEKKTSGKIKASFTKTKNTLGDISLALSSVKFTSNDDASDEDFSGKKDANELYRTTEYKFVIYTETYRFRVFTLRHSAFYPITLTPDEGIGEEIDQDIRIIEDDDSLMNSLEEIFSTQKIRDIITEMMK